MLGYDDPQQVLWDLSDLATHLFIGGAAELEHIRAVLAHEPGLFGYETQLRRRDGSIIHVLMNLLLKPDEQAVWKAVADISERKQAQQRLQNLNEQLEQRVSAAAELEQANQELQQQIIARELTEQALREARDPPRQPIAARTNTWRRPAMTCCNP